MWLSLCRKLSKLLLLSVIDYCLYILILCLLPVPKTPVFLYPRDSKWRHTVFTCRHMSYRHVLKKHARISKETFIIFPHWPFTPTLWISFPLPDESQLPQIFCPLSVTRWISLLEVKMSNIQCNNQNYMFFSKWSIF